MSTMRPSAPGGHGPHFTKEAKEANPYFAMTDEFNHGQVRAILTSGQACVYFRLAFQSKDGDWIVNLDQGDMDHVLSVLGTSGARFRVGSAPLNVAWHEGGWSSHLEILRGTERLRTDFVSRPPRIANDRLAAIWQEIQDSEAPVTDIQDLIQIKKTQREKDWPIIGSLSERLHVPKDILLLSTSPTRLLTCAQQHPELAIALAVERSALRALASGSERTVKEALMGERLDAMEADKNRMSVYISAMHDWHKAWKDFEATVVRMPPLDANTFLCEKAHGILPTHPH